MSTKVFFVLGVVALVGLLGFFNVRFVDAAVFRVVSIPTEEHGYNNFETIVMETRDDMDRFLESVRLQRGWNNWNDFMKALESANVDFRRESLVLVRHTEGSGSVRVDFQPPVQRGSRLILKIERDVPEGGTDDMAYYCFAIVVDKNELAEVKISASGLPSKTIKLAQSLDPILMCPADAKLCPDGSYVSRIGSDCHFAPCP